MERPATAAGVSTEAAIADVQHLLDRVIQQIRTVGTHSDPALEARLQDPELGTVRVLVAGRAGEVVRAVLFVSDQGIADALTRAADRTATSHGLAGIDLHIRTEPPRAEAGANGWGSGPDGGRPDTDPRGWSGTPGGFDRGLQQGRRDPHSGSTGPGGPAVTLPLPAIGVIRRHVPAAGSLDIRA